MAAAAQYNDRTRRLTNRLRSLSMEMESLPTHKTREWRMELKDCFTDSFALVEALKDISALNDDLDKALSDNTFKSNSLFYYQEHLDAFVGLYIHTKAFVGRANKGRELSPILHDVFSSLGKQKCPNMPLFRRLAINPAYIASDDPESRELLTTESFCLPVTQMARMCDVAILRFLSSVTDKTNPDSIVWALDYLTEMTKHLEASLRAQSEIGWCGIRFRKRKDTIRISTIEAPKLALDGQLLVVGFGAPQSPTPGAPILGPDADSPISRIPSILLSEDGGSNSPSPVMRTRSSRDEAPRAPPFFPPVQVNQPRQQRSSRDETQRRRSSVTAPPSFSILEVPQRRSSTGTNPFALSRPPSSRKPSVVRSGSPIPIIGTIVEEESSNRPTELSLDVETKSNSLRPSSPSFIPGSASPNTLFRTPSPSIADDEGTLLDSLQTNEPVKILQASDSDDDDDDDEEEERQSASSPLASAGFRTGRTASPSPSVSSLKYLTPEQLKKEVSSLVTAEGRISLLALLQAISRLPSTLHDLWTEGSWDACQKCFQLIQFCMDFGLDTSQQVTQHRSGAYNNPNSDSVSNLERPSKTYSRLVLQHSLLALIHCAKSMYTGCFSDGCRLSMYTINNSRGGGQILNKMTHQLERLYSNSSLHFREVAMSFARHAPCRQVFHFLHVILQYCPKGPGRDPLDPSLSKRDPLIVLTAAMLRILVDRLNELDLTEQSIQQGIVHEAIAFVHFALCLFSQEFIPQRSFRHLHLYIQRVALSVLLPIPAPTAPVPVTAQSSLDQGSVPTEFGTFPRKKNKEGSEGTPRRRAPTVPGPGYEGKSPQTAKRNPLQKQPSLHQDPNPDPIEPPQIPAVREWRGLNLTVLQMRVRRLSMLMELSEPGKIPEPSLLASLIAVGAPGSVVPRALVFLECALFIQRLREGCTTLWLQNQGEHVGLDVLIMLQKSGKIVGETLRQIELSEKDLRSQSPVFSTSSSPDENTPSPPLFIEEPILPDEERCPEKRYTVSYAIKMAACIYLMELTKLLREPPKSLLPTHGSQTVAGHAFARSISTERRPSNMSSVSTDSETSRPGFPNPYDVSRPQQFRRLSSDVTMSSSAPTPMLDEIPKFTSLDAPSSSPGGFLDAPSSPTPRKLSVFLKVNSRHGRISRAPIHHPRVSHYSRPGEIQVPPDTFKATSPTQSPTKSSFRTRRMSSAAAFGARLMKQPSHDAAGSVRYHAQPTVTVTTHQKSHRRMSMAATMFERPKKDSSPNPPPQVKQPSQSNLKVTGSPTNPHSRHRVSVINRFRKFAFRQHRGKSQESKKRSSTSTQTSSHSGSPMAFRRGTSHTYNRSESMAQCQIEDLQRNFPWLDVVEYLVTSSQCSEPDVRAQRRRACQDLLQALQQVYGGVHDGSQQDTECEASGSRDFTSTLGTLFSNTILTTDSPAQERDRADSVHITTRFDVSANHRQSVRQAMSRLDFSGIPLSSFIQLGMDGLSVENFLESDCATAPCVRRQQHNKDRLDFIHRTMSGLLHAPFSLIVYAAPVLSTDSFTYLREIAWDTLLDADQDLSVAAAAFFLLSCSKEKDRGGVKTFFQEKAKESHNNNSAKKQIIERFIVLWKTRGLVWPRMEEYAQTHFMGGSEEDSSTKDSQAIGYSVPTNLLSSPIDSIPHAPWEPASVCSNQTKTCMQHSERCYQGTLHAPLYHLNDVVGVAKKFSVSSLNIQNETGFLENTYVAVVDHQDYEQGIITITDRLSSNLFPTSLLPLIQFVISNLNHWPSSRHVSGTDCAAEVTATSEVSATAEVAVWRCMVDNPQLFFAPLLHQFNTVYQRMKRHEHTDKRDTDAIAITTTKPFRTLFSHFANLPIKTAQFLFVHFVGIIMRHTEQALPPSNIIVHCVLELLRMVAPHVQGLSMKELKNSLKKESCYTTILSTARIRGVEKIRLITHDKQDQVQEVDDSDMTFALMIAKAQSQNDLEIQSVIQRYYLKDERTKVPVLSTLVIQDHYADTYIPAFSIQHEPADRKKETAIWTEQLDMLLVHKMSECSRLLFTSEMLHSSYNETKSPAKKRYSIPNHEFIFSELLELSSFPRRALESLPYEMGAQALSRQNLCIADNMLRGSWARFMHNLFIKLEKPVDNSIILFLSVVTGSLLLQCEDYTVLRSCLATLLTAAMKFSSVFKLSGYQMVVPTLVQVYALHSKNKLVKEAIKFIWVHFYWKSKNRFLLQVIASVTNLISSEVGNLAIALGANFSPLNVTVNEEEDEDEKLQLVRTLMELLEALNVSCNDLPKDTLDVLGECPPDIAAMFAKERANLDSWTPCSLEIFITLCVTVASFNPEVLRGMQVLVVLDRLMPLLVNKLDYREALIPAVRSLIRGCDTLRHPGLKSDLFSRRTDELFHTEDGPRPPHIKRLLFFRRRQGTSQDIPSHPHPRTHSVSEFPATFDTYLDGFRERNRRQQDVSQKMLRIVCASLLSITSQLASHIASQETSTSSFTAGGTLTLDYNKPYYGQGRLVLDLSSLQTLSTIAIQLLRLAGKVHYEEIIYCKGLVRFMHDLLPNVDWTNDNITVFGNVIERLVKLFKKIQAETSKLSPLVWDGLTAYLQGVLLCVQHNRSTVTENEHITAKLKSLLDVFLTIKQTGLGSAALHTSRPKIAHQLIYEAPQPFTIAIIELSTEMILATKTYPRQHRVQLDTLFRGKLHFKDRELSEFFWAKFFLPVVTQLELKEQSQFTDEDISFIMENIMSVSEHILVHISKSIANSQIFKRYFNVMKVLVCAMSRQFDMSNWLQITHLIVNITTKFDANSQQRPEHTATVAQYTVYAQFCCYFVDFIEQFVVSCRAPLLGFLWPCLSTIEKQLRAAQNQLILQDNATISSNISACLSRCAAIKSWSSLSSTAESRGELLASLQLELHSPSSSTSSPPPTSLSSDPPFVTTSSDELLTQVPRLKRKNSRPPNYPAIQEITEVEPSVATPVTLQHRPTTLGLTFDSDRSPKMGFRSFSPSSRPKVTFADQVPQVQSKTLPPKRQIKKGDGSRKRYMRGRQKRHESSFDADDEGMETPRSSVTSYPSQTWPSRQDSLTSFSSMNTITTNLSLDSPPSSETKAEVTVHDVHSSPRHNALEPAIKTSGLKLLQRQEAVETPSEDEGDEEMEDEEDDDDLSYAKLIVKPAKSNSFKNGSGNAVPISLEPDEPQLYEDDNSDHFQNSLKKSLLYLSSSLPESHSHIT